MKTRAFDGRLNDRKSELDVWIDHIRRQRGMQRESDVDGSSAEWTTFPRAKERIQSQERLNLFQLTIVVRSIARCDVDPSGRGGPSFHEINNERH
jgi:hypothetical protein